jgi:hypothetical protein
VEVGCSAVTPRERYERGVTFRRPCSNPLNRDAIDCGYKRYRDGTIVTLVATELDFVNAAFLGAFADFEVPPCTLMFVRSLR